MSVELPLVKKSYLFTQICSTLNKKSCSIRDFARFIGLLAGCRLQVAGCPGVEYGIIHSKSLEKIKLIALENNEGEFNARMEIPRDVKEDLTWWKENIMLSSKKIKLMNSKGKSSRTPVKQAGGPIAMIRKLMVTGTPNT